MALTDQQAAELLALKAARFKIASGQAVASTEYNGERTNYSKADLDLLRREISALEALAAPVRRRGRAIRFRL